MDELLSDIVFSVGEGNRSDMNVIDDTSELDNMSNQFVTEEPSEATSESECSSSDDEQVNNEDTASDEEQENQCLSYVEEREIRINAIKELFRRSFPTFEEELRALKPVKSVKPRKKKSCLTYEGPLRFSHRLRDKRDHDSHGSRLSVLDEDQDFSDDTSYSYPDSMVLNVTLSDGVSNPVNLSEVPNDNVQVSETVNNIVSIIVNNIVFSALNVVSDRLCESTSVSVLSVSNSISSVSSDLCVLSDKLGPDEVWSDVNSTEVGGSELMSESLANSFESPESLYINSSEVEGSELALEGLGNSEDPDSCFTMTNQGECIEPDQSGDRELDKYGCRECNISFG